MLFQCSEGHTSVHCYHTLLQSSAFPVQWSTYSRSSSHFSWSASLIDWKCTAVHCIHTSPTLLRAVQFTLHLHCHAAGHLQYLHCRVHAGYLKYHTSLHWKCTGTVLQFAMGKQHQNSISYCACLEHIHWVPNHLGSSRKERWMFLCFAPLASALQNDSEEQVILLFYTNISHCVTVSFTLQATTSQYCRFRRTECPLKIFQFHTNSTIPIVANRFMV